MSKATAEDYVRTKHFPEDYPKDVIDVLRAMSFTDLGGVKLLGSMSLRSQLYAGDYDAYEIVELRESSKIKAIQKLAYAFQNIIRGLMRMNDLTIGDIKCGEVKEWQIIPEKAFVENKKVMGLNPQKSIERLTALYKEGIVKKEDYEAMMAILSKPITVESFFLLREMAKYHIIRWKPSEVLQGFKLIGPKGPKERKYTLEEGFESKSLTKMDTVAYVENNRYTDFSMIYECKNNGKVLNMGITDIEQSLKENILGYMMKGNYFKMAKRMFALAKYKLSKPDIRKLAPLFNTDLGLMYQVVGDIGTLLYLFESEKHLKFEKIKYETDQFKNRLANIYTLKKWFNEEEEINERLSSVMRLPDKQRTKSMYIGVLEFVQGKLETLLKNYAKIELEKIGMIPVPKRFLP